MKRLVIIAAFALSGCNGEASEAERQHKMVLDAQVELDIADEAALCRSSREVQAEWLKAGDEAKYREWTMWAKLHCEDAQKAGQELKVV